MQGAQGPIPLPVATNTRRLKSGTILKTPQVGIPLTQSDVGGFSICLLVQSPARDTTSEYPFIPGSGTVAKPCHSIRGLSEIRVKVPGTGVTTVDSYKENYTQVGMKTHTVIEIEPNSVVRQDFGTHRYFPQASPRKNDRACEDDK